MVRDPQGRPGRLLGHSRQTGGQHPAQFLYARSIGRLGWIPNLRDSPMNIVIVTPAPPRSRQGNRVTALRWSRILRSLGHRVVVAQQYERTRCDVLVALHARKSFPSISRFNRRHPDLPLIVALTGTDLYADIHTHRSARESLRLASRLIVLQAQGIKELPPTFRRKTRVIVQSVRPPRGPFQPKKNVFEVCVLGHLRPVKDPFRTAMAVR